MEQDVRTAIESVLDNGKDYGIENGNCEVLAQFAAEAVRLMAEIESK